MSFDFGAELPERQDNYKAWPTEGSFTALVDADLLPYIVGYTIDPAKYAIALSSVGDGMYERVEDTPGFLDAADQMNWNINTWINKAGADSALFFITESESNYRLDVCFTKPYKGQRRKDKPPFFYELKRYLIDVHGARVAQGEEADDLIVTEMWRRHRLLEGAGAEVGSMKHQRFSDVISISTDKDLRICPGWHYDPGKDMKSWGDVLGDLTPEYKDGKRGPIIHKLRGSGLKFFYAQLVMGDSADNYPGVPMKGPGAAYDAVHPCTSEAEMFDAVLSLYEEKYAKNKGIALNYRGGAARITPLQMMLEQGRLAWMRTHKGEIWKEELHCPLGTDPVWQ